MLPPPPLDLVLVFRYDEEWVQEERLCNKVSKVYFHAMFSV